MNSMLPPDIMWVVRTKPKWIVSGVGHATKVLTAVHYRDAIGNSQILSINSKLGSNQSAGPLLGIVSCKLFSRLFPSSHD